MHIKRVSLELVGQSPFIVCQDADLDQAAAACSQRAFSNMGQICISVNRIYVAEVVAEPFTERLVRHAEGARGGRDLQAPFGDGKRAVWGGNWGTMVWMPIWRQST